MRETLGGRKNYQLFIRPSVSNTRLKEFKQNPQTHGPKIRNTYLDKRGLTTQHLQERPWNQQVTYIMAKNAEGIVNSCKDQRFGDAVDWLALFSERIYRVYLDVVKGRPKAVDAAGTKENSQQIQDRLVDSHLSRIKHNGETNSRHAVCFLICLFIRSSHNSSML
ncbi:hypothetical protein GG344DRAFT_56827 [Lentinula edodes]|nr:hypothetical protein GG344DRAFT_56827 [Lentinula edodes]